MCPKLEICLREADFLQGEEMLFKNFDISKMCNNEIEDNNEKFMQWIQGHSFAENRFHGLWSSQRPSAREGIIFSHFFLSSLHLVNGIRFCWKKAWCFALLRLTKEAPSVSLWCTGRIFITWVLSKREINSSRSRSSTLEQLKNRRFILRLRRRQ